MIIKRMYMHQCDEGTNIFKMIHTSSGSAVSAGLGDFLNIPENIPPLS